jgi:hypothetical protein
MEGDLLKFGGSLAAVALVVLLVWRLGLGPPPQISNEDEARELADNAICGFDAEELTLDAKGRGALLADRADRIVLLVPHGAHFAARLLDARARASINGEQLKIDSGDASFPIVQFELGEATQAWDKRISTLHS